MRISSRITILAASAVAIAVALVALGAFLTVKQVAMGSLDDSLTERAEQAAEAGALPELVGDVPPSVLGAADIRIAVLSPGAQVASADSGPGVIELGSPELAVAHGRSAKSLRTVVDEDGSSWRVVATPLASGGALVLAQSLEPTQRLLRQMGFVMLLIGGGGIVVAALVGRSVATSSLAPVRRLTSAVEVWSESAAQESGPPQTLTEPGSKELKRSSQQLSSHARKADEIARLSASFDDLHRRLTESSERQRRLVSDAGHELRTPLTSLRTNFELLVQSEDPHQPGLTPELRADLTSSVLAQIDELTNLIADLVELARPEHPSAPHSEFDLADAVHDALERVQRRAIGVPFEVDLHPWPVRGDRASIERAVLNILDNAVKWNAPSGTVTVTLRNGELTIDDEGPGISDNERQQVFERFWRSVDARTMPGSGLGLSIVQDAVRRHGGEVSIAESPSGGARMTVCLPGAHPA